MISVLEGSFSRGGSGIKRRSILMFLFKVWTRFLSRAFASLLCLLIPLSLGPRRFGLFFWPMDSLSLGTESIVQITQTKSQIAKQAVNLF